MIEVLWYNSEALDLAKIQPIKNNLEYISRNKPDGGLWTSPIQSDWGWKEWCRLESPNWIKGMMPMMLEIEDSNILIIDSEEKTKALPTIGNPDELWLYNNHPPRIVDYEKLAETYDAIWVVPFKNWRSMHLTYCCDWNSWDCETVLIINPKCIKGIKTFEESYLKHCLQIKGLNTLINRCKIESHDGAYDNTFVLLQPYSKNPGRAFVKVKSFIHNIIKWGYLDIAKQIFSPILHTHHFSIGLDMDVSFYYDWDYTIYERFKRPIFIVIDDDFADSKGVNAEIKWALINNYLVWIYKEDN